MNNEVPAGSCRVAHVGGVKRHFQGTRIPGIRRSTHDPVKAGGTCIGWRSRARRVLSLVAACTGSPKPDTRSTPSTSPIPRGGTLLVGVVRYPSGDPVGTELWGPLALDPSLSFFLDSVELFRCCLARTLLSYPGRPTREEGAILQPDLAESMPEVSLDGLTWTFRLREGLHYGPPLAEQCSGGGWKRGRQGQQHPFGVRLVATGPLPLREPVSRLQPHLHERRMRPLVVFGCRRIPCQ